MQCISKGKERKVYNSIYFTIVSYIEWCRKQSFLPQHRIIKVEVQRLEKEKKTISQVKPQ